MRLQLLLSTANELTLMANYDFTADFAAVSCINYLLRPIHCCLAPALRLYGR